MNKKVKWGLVAFIVCALVCWGIYSQMPKQNSELSQADKVEAGSKGKNKVLNVNGMRVKKGVLSDEIMVTGTLLPDEEVDLSFETSGQVVEIMFKEGAHVKKGQLLARVNDKVLRAELRRLSSQLKLANDRVYRQRTLLQHDAVSQEAYEQVKTELATLKAEIDAVKAQIEQTELRAPFDGVIGLRQIRCLCFSYDRCQQADQICSPQGRICRSRALCQGHEAGHLVEFLGRRLLADLPCQGLCKRVCDRHEYPYPYCQGLVCQCQRFAFTRPLCQHQPQEAGNKRRYSHTCRGSSARDG